MLHAIYDSPWHNPAFFWAASVAFLAWWMWRKPFLSAFIVLFTVEILADALVQGGWSPEVFRAPNVATPLSIAFVILGDLRYFLLVERFARRPDAAPAAATPPAAWAAAAGLSLIVPVASAVVNRALAARLSDPRWTYLTYEAMFLALALTLRFAWLPRRLAASPAAVRAFLLRVTAFEGAQYALWVIADVIILAGADLGFGLRLLPNAMYYAFFLPFVARAAPAEVNP